VLVDLGWIHPLVLPHLPFFLNCVTPVKEAEIQFWQAYRDNVLLKLRVIDPACGSGAFLVAAFDYLLRQYERVNQALAGLKEGQRSLFDLSKTILNNNLYGVDLSPESVEITKLSLWLKTAERGKALTYLDDNIKVGNSIVADPQVADRAFNWEAGFPQVFADGGFDVAIGNPPYVRQELLSPIKPYLQQHYDSYDGVADLYTYFYEKGLKILRRGGVMSYIVTNKWLRSGYGEPLRRFFSFNSVLEQMIDFGHAPIFEDADTFPCIVVARKPLVQPVAQVKPMDSAPVVVCPVPREKLAEINLLQYVGQEGFTVPWSRFTENAWSLEPPAVDALMAKIRRVGVPLKDFTGVKPCYGIKTGFNEAFLIDDVTKKQILQADPKSAEIIKPYLRGQDIRRWISDWKSIWMIFSRRGIDIDAYPAVKAHLSNYREQLEPRPKDWDSTKSGDWKGRKPGSYKWYELQDSIDYWQEFGQPKLIWKDLSTYSEFCFDNSGIFTNDLCFILASSDFWLLAVLNSPLMWYYLYRTTIHGVNETLRLKNIYTENLPIAPPTDVIRAEVEPLVSRLIELTKSNQEAYSEVLNWLELEQNIDKPGQKLENFASLDVKEFVQELKKRRPKTAGVISPPALKAMQQVYNDYAPAIQTRKAEALRLEHRLSDLVNQAYGLTPAEIDLMWNTAPPRMPIHRDPT
ncbi:DNA methyltransferase, partial [Leptolyngbyaceae cyanobacterium UHCC 1019]